MHVDQLWEFLDVCRDRTELDDPDLQAAAEAVRKDPAAEQYLAASLRFDRVISNQLQQPPPPAGLEEQVLAALASAVTAGPETELEPPADVTSDEFGLSEQVFSDESQGGLDQQLALQAKHPSISRFGWTKRSRPFWLTATGLAATLLVALALSANFWRPLDKDELFKRARDWPELVNVGEWKFDLDDPPRDRYSMASGLNAVATGWQNCPMPGFDRAMVVYRLETSRGRQQGLLFVAKRRVSGLPEEPPTEPESSTANRCVGAWKTNDYVYVLIVEGSTSDFHRFVDVPVARAMPDHSLTRRRLVALRQTLRLR